MSGSESETNPVLFSWNDDQGSYQGEGDDQESYRDEAERREGVESVGVRQRVGAISESTSIPNRTEETKVVMNGMSGCQRVACYISHVLAMVCVGLVGAWISDEAMGGGGVSWAAGDAQRVFNWHPILMVTAFAFMTVASLSFRIRVEGSRKGGRRKVLKFVHGVQWTLAAICAVVGLMAVLASHNNAESGYVANMYSLHSWIGLGVLLLYFYQLISATFSFAANLVCLSSSRRAGLLSFHSFMGTYVYIFVTATILLGIQEKEGFVGCAYRVNSPDTTPWTHYNEISRACRISHGLGLAVFVTALCTSYALYNFPGNQNVRNASTR